MSGFGSLFYDCCTSEQNSDLERGSCLIMRVKI